MRFLIRLITRVCLRLECVGHNGCEWANDQYEKRFWYQDVARSTGRFYWRAHDDFWMGRAPIFWD